MRVTVQGKQFMRMNRVLYQHHLFPGEKLSIQYPQRHAAQFIPILKEFHFLTS